MRITFENREEWDDFMNSFEGDKYGFALKLDGSYEILSLKTIKEETALFPITLEARKNLVQICGVKSGKRFILCPFDEMELLALNAWHELGEDAVMMSRVFSLDDWYDSGRQYSEVLNPYLTEKLMNVVKKSILTDGKSYTRVLPAKKK